jgi:hypothetical protein
MATRTAVISERPFWYTPAPFTLKGGEATSVATREWGLASDLLGEQSPANTLFVVLGKEGTQTRIVMSHELELSEMVHGLFSFSELGFTDEEVAEYFEMVESLEKMREATTDARIALADGVAEMARQRTTLAFLAPNPLAAAFRKLEVRSFQADLEKLRHHLDHCAAIQEAMEAVMTEVRGNALMAITARFKPTRFALDVGTILRLRTKEKGE